MKTIQEPKKITCPNCGEIKLSLIGILKFKGITTKEFECSNCQKHLQN